MPPKLVYPGRTGMGSPAPDSLGAAIFGPGYGPIPAIDAPPAEEPFYDDQGYGTPDEGANPYLPQVQQYLASLQEPVTLPAPPPVPQGTALAMVLNPEMAEGMMSLHREPYQRQMQEYQMNEARRGKAADLAARLAQQEEQRRERTWEKRHLWEQSAANAGVVGYPFQLPGMRDAARMNDQAKRSLMGQRNRSNNSGVGVGPRPKFPTRQHAVSWLEEQMRMRQSQLSKMYEASAMPGWDRNVSAQNVVSDVEEDYGRLRRQREAMTKMNEDQYRRYSELSEEEQDAVIDSMNRNPGDLIGTHGQLASP